MNPLDYSNYIQRPSFGCPYHLAIQEHTFSVMVPKHWNTLTKEICLSPSITANLGTHCNGHTLYAHSLFPMSLVPTPDWHNATIKKELQPPPPPQCYPERKLSLEGNHLALCRRPRSVHVGRQQNIQVTDSYDNVHRLHHWSPLCELHLMKTDPGTKKERRGKKAILFRLPDSVQNSGLVNFR